MITDFKEKLKDIDSPEHSALLGHVKRLIGKSRNDMSQNYSKWDENQRIFESRRALDKEDRNSLRRGEPTKLIVPLTFAQIMTFVSFNVMSITQNSRFYELEPTGREDNVIAEPMELVLERDIRRNSWNTFLVQFFLDVGRFSLAAGEVCYTEEVRNIRVQGSRTIMGAYGAPQEEQTNEFQQIPTFLGNKVYSVSPYRFYPDTSFPLSRYQEGEFCGSEDVFSLTKLQSMGDEVFNLDKIPKFTEEVYKERMKTSRADIGVPNKEVNPNLLGFGTDAEKTGTKVKHGAVVLTKIVLDIIPKNFGPENKFVKLGTEDFPIRYICWVANDATIVRFEESTYLHGMFPYFCGQYIPDQHNNVNQSLADICDQITNLVTWKLNTHVASQKNSVESKYIVDPAGIDIKTLESRSPYIFLKKNASQTGIDRYIKQFTTVDTTQNVMQDIAALKDLNEGITGNSAQMQGQYSQGRRSATQDRVVAQGAGARGKTTLGSIWDTAFEPLGKQLIANNRQEMDFDTFSRIMGEREWPANVDAQPQLNPQTGQPEYPKYTTEEIFTMFKADPVSIALSEDFFVFDGTLPSEKAYLAQSLQEILLSIMQNPVVGQVLGFGPDQIKELFNQIYLLRGVTPARLPVSAPTPPIATPNIQALPAPATA